MALDLRGQTALITGASSGIGKDLAIALGRSGVNLVITARRKAELDALAQQLRANSAITVEVIAHDLGKPGASTALLKDLAKRKLAIDILINNAGFGTNSRVVNEDSERVQEEITLNIAALTDLTIGLLPGMVERNRGAVINVASTASFQPVPGMAVYAATKAYVRSFTEALWGELTNTNVRAFAVSPGATATSFFDIAGASPSSALAPVSEVVDVVLAALTDANAGPGKVVGGRNRVMAGLTSILPKKLVIGVAGKMFLPKDGA
jgi:short-subunit dehydrogenase